MNKYMLLGRLLSDLEYYKKWGCSRFQQLSLNGNIQEIEKIWKELIKTPKWTNKEDIDILIKECQEKNIKKNT